MTYLEYLLIFIILPIVVEIGILYTLQVKYNKRISFIPSIISIILLSCIALIYTTPWDNYLVAHTIWSYDPQKVVGIILGYVPIEEYSFFILQTLFVSLILTIAVQLQFVSIPNNNLKHFDASKLVFVSMLTLLWFFCLLCYISGIETMLYMNLLLLWGLPPIIFQVIVGWKIMRNNAKAIILIILASAIYLSLTDFIAIFDGVWTINSKFTVGIVFGVIPLEEILFFFITSSLITLGFILANHYIKTFLLTKSFRNDVKKVVSSG